uniref:CSON012080 protein n=2 Tax=Culicoides sonorensis TaxID=179676 RepID=A0A336M8W0_CULSO
MVTILTVISFFVRNGSCTLAQAIKDVLQYNVAGIPLTHEKMEVEFDPEVSKKRRELYYELHGYRGEKLIERLGLGIDGNHKERLVQQQARDNGKLGGLAYFQP